MTTKTPEHILLKIRPRLVHDENTSDMVEVDAEINTMTPMEKLRHVCAWELGHQQWADTIIGFAKDCGMAIIEDAADAEYQYQSGFVGQDWSACSKEHHDMVVSNPRDYAKDGYSVRRLLVLIEKPNEIGFSCGLL